MGQKISKTNFITLIALFFISFYAVELKADETVKPPNKRWSIEVLTGLNSFTGDVGNDYKMGYELGFKFENRPQKKFGVYGILNYNSYPTYEYIYNGNQNVKSDLSCITLAMGGMIYFKTNNLLLGFSPYIGGEVAYAIFSEKIKVKEGSEFVNNGSNDFVNFTLSPVLGATYPISNDFLLSGRLKYNLNLLGNSPYSSFVATDFNSLSFNLGIIFLFE